MFLSEVSITSLFFLFKLTELSVRCITLMKEIMIGILAAFFFGFTFILNHSMQLDGGSWLWSASLRYLFMVPFLIAIVWLRGGFKRLRRLLFQVLF